MFSELSGTATDLKQRLETFMVEHVYPHEHEILSERSRVEGRWEPHPRVAELKRKAQAQGLWNLFYTHGPEGQGLSNYEYTHLCELLGRSLAAPEIWAE